MDAKRALATLHFNNYTFTLVQNSLDEILMAAHNIILLHEKKKSVFFYFSDAFAPQFDVFLAELFVPD